MNPIKSLPSSSDTVEYHPYDANLPMAFNEVKHLRHFLPLLVGAIAFQGNDYPILLYVLPPESDVYTGWITFRDYMRTHAEDAQAYDTVKQQAISAGKVEGSRYQPAKTPFLVSVMAKIQQAKP